jgi:hypothetical protein
MHTVVRVFLALLAIAVASLLPWASALAVTATNGILTIDYDDVGRFSLTTGARHPVPDSTVFFPVGTSYISVRDDTRNRCSSICLRLTASRPAAKRRCN